ncbi:HNH endonuclease signature motif containing protein [Armatimonas rosea]|uniref:HNH endonuclease n=1 Tax=Armatimonas rosea TaxID=685828 RepID=UPI001617C47B
MISARLRREIRSLYGACCGYCGVCEEDVGSALTLDHFQPVASQGQDTRENLVYCCFACNAFKGDYWPDDPNLRLESDGYLTALTPAGERQIHLLHLNRPPLIRQRFRAQERRLERRTHQELRRELEQMEHRLQRLERLFPFDDEGESSL